MTLPLKFRNGDKLPMVTLTMAPTDLWIRTVGSVTVPVNRPASWSKRGHAFRNRVPARLPGKLESTEFELHLQVEFRSRLTWPGGLEVKAWSFHTLAWLARLRGSPYLSLTGRGESDSEPARLTKDRPSRVGTNRWPNSRIRRRGGAATRRAQGGPREAGVVGEESEASTDCFSAGRVRDSIRVVGFIVSVLRLVISGAAYFRPLVLAY